MPNSIDLEENLERHMRKRDLRLDDGSSILSLGFCPSIDGNCFIPLIA